MGTIGDVAGCSGSERDVDFELHVEQMLVDQRPPHAGRVYLNQLFERAEISAQIIEGPAKMCFARIDLFLKTDWMAKLIDRPHFPPDATLHPPPPPGPFPITK